MSSVLVFPFRFVSFSFLPCRHLNSLPIRLRNAGAGERTAGRSSGLHGPTMSRDDYPIHHPPTTCWTNAPQRPEDVALVLSHFPVTQQGLGSSLSSMHSYSPNISAPFVVTDEVLQKTPPSAEACGMPWGVACWHICSSLLLRSADTRDVVEDVGVSHL